jgi:hypothetical protein
MTRKSLLGLALGVLLGLGTPALAQPTPEPASPVSPAPEFFAGKRVWVDWNGTLVPTGEITQVLEDGSYEVAVYEHNPKNDPRTTQPEEAYLRGSPLGTVRVAASDMQKWNQARFTTWVEVGGKPWPKAEVLADTGDSVTVRIFDKDGTTVTEDRVISDPAELARYRALNVATQPAAGKASSELDDATRTAVEKINADLAAKENKLSTGEVFPAVSTVTQVVGAIRSIADRYVEGLRSEASAWKRADLQDKMMREVYVTFERMSWIKHGGRDTTTAEWKAEGARLAALLPKDANPLQRELVARVSSCYGKSEVVWKILNLARIPELTGVGVRLLDGGFHGLLYTQYDDKSRRTWETTEGFEPHGTRAFKRWEVMFSGKGDKGAGLAYFDKVTPTPGTPAHPIDNDLVRKLRGDRAGTPDSPGLTSVLKDRIADASHPEDAAKDR